MMSEMHNWFGTGLMMSTQMAAILDGAIIVIILGLVVWFARHSPSC
jgi:hypothetical protein